jgi:hypothetical protein
LFGTLQDQNGLHEKKDIKLEEWCRSTLHK